MYQKSDGKMGGVYHKSDGMRESMQIPYHLEGRWHRDDFLIHGGVYQKSDGGHGQGSKLTKRGEIEFLKGSEKRCFCPTPECSGSSP